MINVSRYLPWINVKKSSHPATGRAVEQGRNQDGGQGQDIQAEDGEFQVSLEAVSRHFFPGF